jgi:hypothetical protein
MDFREESMENYPMATEVKQHENLEDDEAEYKM